ncbi:MAG TPA: hypothetical protein PLL20_06375 [Phycisphaerae bacterium]|mgnify:CR=1 FL=1|nr:hypothetical protein [Phycisphaerae bacterium]
MTPYAPYPLNLVRDWFDRRRWWVRLVLAVVLVPWFGYFAYTRMTTRPAAPYIAGGWSDAGLAIPDPAVDVSVQLANALTTLTATPTTFPAPTTAPAGMEWMEGEDYEAWRKGQPVQRRSAKSDSIDLWTAVALDGEWNPTTRYHLTEIVRYLDLATTKATLDRIVELSGKPFCISQARFGFTMLSSCREAARTLTVRARRAMAERNDLDSALSDIRTVLNLASGLEDDQRALSMMVGTACRCMALWEMTHWPEEMKLDNVQLRRLQNLVGTQRRDPRQLAETMLRSDHLLLRDFANQMYTGDDRDGGWFVPTYCCPEIADHPSLGLLNLLSPFYDNREQAKNRLDDYCRNQLVAIDTPTPPPSSISRHSRGWQSWDPTLPFKASQGQDWSWRIRWRTERDEMWVDGTITVLALAAYRNDHGRFPEALEEMVPRYLEALPIDPGAGRPLRYKRETEGDYRLYSVWEDGKDDGGVERDANSGELLDLLIHKTRQPATFNEWFLVPAGTTTRATGDSDY